VKCNRVVDAGKPHLEVPPLPEDRARGFHILGCSIVYEGLCPECRSSEEAERE
jgi:hypothetical protein